jgi:hypothetical protein
MSNFCLNLKEQKEYCKDYTFEALCGLLITTQHRFIEEGNISGKHQTQLLKGKGKMDPRDRVRFDAFT